MVEPRDFEGRDVGEALASAAADLGVPVSALRYELMEEGRRGILGLGAKLTRIRVLEVAAEPGAPPPEPRPAPAAAEPSPWAEAVRATLERMLALARLELTVETIASTNGVRLALRGRDRKLLLQREGELLEALQTVLQRMARRRWPEAGSVQLDCEGAPRRGGDEDLVAMVREIAEQVLRTGQPRRLRELNPYERRLVHVTVGSYRGLTSTSEGDGFLKPMVVATAVSPD